MYIFWPAVVIFVIGTAIGLTREWILWKRDRAEESRHIHLITEAWIRDQERKHEE